MYEDPRPLSTVRKSVPPGLEQVISRAIAKVAADRFATVAEFAAALDDPLYAARTPASPVVSPAGRPRGWRGGGPGAGAPGTRPGAGGGLWGGVAPPAPA